MSDTPDNTEARIEAGVLGESADPIRIATREHERLAALALARQARRSLLIFNCGLDTRLFDDSGFLESAQALALRSKVAKIQVLLKEPTRLLREGGRFIVLTQRLTSFMDIRIVGADHARVTEAFMVVDETGYLHKNIDEEFEGVVDFNDVARARYLTRQFDEYWRYSDADPNVHRLHI